MYFALSEFNRNLHSLINKSDLTNEVRTEQMIRCQNNELHVCPHHMCALHIQSQSHMLGFMRMRTVITLFMKELWGVYRRTDSLISLMDCWFSAVDTWKAVKVSLCFGFASIICQFGSQFRGWNGRNDWNTNDRN